MEVPLVELRGVSRSYGHLEAVRDLSLTLGPGISYGLVGRNGAGKSTLLRMILGMLRPDRGSVRLFGGDPINEAERVKLHVGYLAEDQEYPGSLRPRDLFGFFGRCYPTWDWSFAQSLVDRFNIPVDRALSQLSKGEQRQASLVCAVAHRPKLLVLDEPGGGLDPVVRRRFLEQVIDLLAGEETSVLFSSHHLQEVERIAGRIGILDRGRLLLEDDVDRLKEHSCRLLVEITEQDGRRIKESLEGCVQAERRADAWVLTMLCGELEAKERIRARLGGRVRQMQPLSIEDLFISMVG